MKAPEAYKENITPIVDSINELHAELREARQEHIDTYKPYNIGDKLKLTRIAVAGMNSEGEYTVSPERIYYAYVYDFRIGGSGNVIPKLKKAKKDGSMGKREEYGYAGKIELVTPG